MVNRYFLTRGASQTKKLGEKFAKKILNRKPKKNALILALEGELGGGKTTFLQGFARGLGIKDKILSPTFIIMQRFKIKPSAETFFLKDKKNLGFKNFYHFDCYRIKKQKDILNLGFREIIANPQNIVAIEWAERIKKILPKDIFGLKFKFVSKNIRKIVVKSKNV
jgi:tRNA threonylcarbamoyladenosine biosynthesis protein TsaE